MVNESNNYCETLIRPAPDGTARLLTGVCLGAAVLCLLLFLLFGGWLFLLLTAAVLVLWYFNRRRSQVEYEYQFWGRQLDIECIYGAEKRKPLATYQMDQVEALAPQGDASLADYQGRQMPTRDLTARAADGAEVYAMYVRDGELRRVLLQPSEEMLRNMWRVAPERVHIPARLRAQAEEP